MLRSSASLLNRKQFLLLPLSAPLIFTPQSSSIPNRILIPTSNVSSISFVSQSIKSESPLRGFIRSNQTMASQSTKSVHDFTVKDKLNSDDVALVFLGFGLGFFDVAILDDAKGNDVDLSIYKGKVLLIVNVASQCGLTNSNYSELGQLYESYKDKGLEILAFPCNQFGGQEPGSNDEIVEFVCTRFKAEYPIFDKIDVNGDSTAPLYKYLKSAKGGLFGDSIKWNFAKFLVDKEGNVVNRYAPTTSPLSIKSDIEKLLQAS